jgi:hypothetical protein
MLVIMSPEWNGEVPGNMIKIWSPTNLAWINNRILVKGPSDLPNIHKIQDKIIVKPLSAFQGKTVPAQSTADASLSKEVPIGPQPTLATTLHL